MLGPPMLVGALHQHRPAGVGKDRNLFEMGHLKQLPRSQHRPSGVGEDRNRQSVTTTQNDYCPAPALRGQ